MVTGRLYRKKRVYCRLCFSEPSAIPARALTKAVNACEGRMPLQSQSDSDFDARRAAWLAPGAAHNRALRRRV